MAYSLGFVPRMSTYVCAHLVNASVVQSGGEVCLRVLSEAKAHNVRDLFFNLDVSRALWDGFIATTWPFVALVYVVPVFSA